MKEAVKVDKPAQYILPPYETHTTDVLCGLYTTQDAYIWFPIIKIAYYKSSNTPIWSYPLDSDQG